ncbi:DUF1579 domain-containing protein [Flavobacterium poyangense]|uniref:DUF1579 domain-containing protein n=1 Tax=Flavobacterium poyangense TaxID=2204302 RepID=UPI00142468C0|nr:DUF1579 domain-containing protein [Flavobacterium sp. JXAS1]
MKKVYVILSMSVLCFSSCKKDGKTDAENAKVADSVKTAEAIAEQPLDSAAQEKAWIAYATPGASHKMMADETGTWKCEMTFWMEPNGKPQKASSTAVSKMILGGRYQESSYKGMMMGQPFEGKSTLAYNNANKEYTTTFIDNMGTGMIVATGTYDEKSKSINFKGDMVNPFNGKKSPYREIYTIVDATTRKMEMFEVKKGQEYKSMEILMKKQ